MNRFLFVVVSLVGVVGCALVAVNLLYGSGQPFPDRSSAPAVDAAAVEIAASLDFPSGCVTISTDGRVFFDTHPFAAPGRFGEPHVFELVDGEPRPWPNEEAQKLFVAPFGLTTDTAGRLWVVEPATLDRIATRLLGFEIETGKLIFEHSLPDGEARFAQDLHVSPDGRYLVLADTGAFEFTPGQLLVFKIETKEVVRTFRHASLNPQDWFIERFDGRPHRIGWGLLTFKVGVDGISFSPDGEWLYYATMSHDTLYRVPSALLLDASVGADEVEAAIQVVGAKPQSDGIATTSDGRILLTDVKHGGIAELTPDGRLRTLTASNGVLWADSVEVAPNGEVWFTDSSIPGYLQEAMQPPPREILDAGAPYSLYRFKVP